MDNSVTKGLMRSGWKESKSELTDSVSSAEGLGGSFREFGMEREFEVQQIHLHLTVLHVEPILHHRSGERGGGGERGEGKGGRRECKNSV